MRSVDAGLLDVVGEHANVFLLAPTFDSQTNEWCSDLLGFAGSGDDSIIFVTDNRTPDEFLDGWRSRHGQAYPNQMGFVTLHGTVRSASGSNVAEAKESGTTIAVRSVDSPGNLTKLGVEMDSLLTEWPEDDSNLAVCFDSLTALIQYADVEKVYRFLHVFTNQVRGEGAKAHYHLDPAAHDPTDINLLTTTGDAVVERDENGDVSVRTR